MKRILILLLALGVLSGALAQDMPGEGVTVRPAIANWESARPIAQLVVTLLEELGYDVEDPSTLANPIFYQSLVNGDIDYWAHSWMPNQNNQLPSNFDEEAAFAGTVLEQGALQGYMIDRATAEAFGITSLADFQREEVRAAFDADGDGRADLVGCEAGWACAEIVQGHIEANGLEDAINVLDASYNAMFADVLARFNNGESVLYYTWTPYFTVYEIPPGEDAVWINVPEMGETDDPELMESMTVSGIPGIATDPLVMGFPANDIRIAANQDFLDENPAATALFGEVKMDMATVSEMTVRINNGESSPEEVAAMVDEWIAANRDMIDGWLETARAAAQ
jgi:glycine betaine/proline transport system substrate-binding protein